MSSSFSMHQYKKQVPYIHNPCRSPKHGSLKGPLYIKVEIPLMYNKQQHDKVGSCWVRWISCEKEGSMEGQEGDLINLLDNKGSNGPLHQN